jgi:catechol 2,3-dioxygenase-like lactoylglutathione lyase family enzyme
MSGFYPSTKRHSSDTISAKETRVLRIQLGILLTAIASAQTQAPPGEVIGVGNFSHITANLDKSLEFYRDVLGLDPAAPARPFDGNPAIAKLGDTPGAQSRFVQLRVPGSAMGVEIIEYKDIDRKPAHPRFQDPGAANLILRVRDLDAVMARVKKSDAKILSIPPTPATNPGGARVIFIQDSDGFIVELNQPNPLPTTTAAATSNVIGGGFELAVEDAEKIGPYYRALGFQPSVPASFNGDKLMTDTAGTPGARFRQSRAVIPGTTATIVFIEFNNIDRKPLHTRVQDPGTAILQLTVRDVDTLLPKLKTAGFSVVTTGGEPVAVGNSRIVLVRDPNNLLLELIQRGK